MGNLSLNLLSFPLWWYTTGWNFLWAWNKRQLELDLRQTGPVLFFQHLQEPLYGDYSKSGKALGLFSRPIMTIFKLLFLIFRLLALTLVDIVFLLLLPCSLAMVIFQLTPP